MTFSKSYFSSVIVFTIYNYEPNFKEKFLRESGFPIFGQKFYVARSKLVFWPPFCNFISDFRFFGCILVLLDYFISGPHFINTKYFSELGTIGTPLDH